MHNVFAMLRNAPYLLIRVTSKKHDIPIHNMLNESIDDLVQK